MLTSDALPPDPVHGLRTPILTGRMSAKLLWLYAARVLADGTPRPLKVRVIAVELDVRRSAIRRGLADLCTAGLLVCTTAPTRGTPGEYQLGPAAWRHTTRATPR